MASRIWLMLVLVAAIVVVGALAGFAEEPEVQVIRIGTGPTGGSYFPIGGVLANLISHPPGALDCAAGGSCGVPGLIASALSTAGSVENIAGLTVGSLDMALVQADVARLAYRGEGAFADEPAHSDLRAIASLHPEAVHVVIRANGPIEGIAELRGKRVSLGAEQSGTRVTAGMVLPGYNLRLDRIQPVFESLGRASDMLADGEIDAFFMVGGYPLSAIQHAAENIGIRLLPIEGAASERLRERFPFFTASVIPEGTYHEVAATPTLSVQANLVVDASMSEDLVYAITRALWRPENMQVLSRELPETLRFYAADATTGIALPLHDGAARFYREVGLLGVETATP